ncbi:MAG: right-handed parallel beta-helix repeat-containing protein [Armatimonadota bacterium]
MTDFTTQIVAVALIVWLASTAMGATYYVSPDGDDGASGTEAEPWQTIQHVNKSLEPGDTAVFMDGEYYGVINPAVSGTEDAPITYRAAHPKQAVLKGESGSPAIAMEDRTRVVIDGFHVLPMGNSGWMRLIDSDYITVQNCRFEDSRGFHIFCRNCHYNRYLNNEIIRLMKLNQWGHCGANQWDNYDCTHCVFEGNHFSRCGHRPLGFLYESPYNVVRNNVFENRWGRNFEFFSTRRMLIENNIITNGFDGSGSADGRAKLFVIDSIFRTNLVFRNYYMPLVINSYHYRGFPDPFAMLDSRLYNNTWYRNHDGAFQMVDYGGESDRDHWVDGNIFVNNIFANNDPGGEHKSLYLWGNIGTNNKWLSNAFRGDEPGQVAIRYDDVSPGLTEWPGLVMTAEEANEKKPEQFEGNADLPPHFVDAEADNYRLAEDSPCIDAGRPLTTATEAGEGRMIPVEDARYFYDGFGIPGEQGDRIVIGTDRQEARVDVADIQKNILQVDREVSWGAGAPVTMPYTGEAPDLGAYEMEADGSDWYSPPEVPDGPRLPTMETATEPTVRVGFEEENREEWHYLWNFSRQRNTDSRLDDTTANTGERSMRVYAEDDGAIMACDVRPRWWDIDRFPYARFAYRIPEGVPVGIFVYAFAGRDVGRGGVCLGGSPAHDAGSYPQIARYELIDDGEWHEIKVDVRDIREVHPDVKLMKMFRFYTEQNGKKGDQFWFDDFVILPAEQQ